MNLKQRRRESNSGSNGEMWSVSHVATLLAAGCLLLCPLVVRASEVDYARDVRPIFLKNCIRCHGAKKQEGGLRLDLRRQAYAGGDTGPGIVPGKTEGEVLRRLASRDEKVKMPPEQALAESEIATLRAWVVQGAKWPDEFAGKEPAEEHWAFRPLKRPAVPDAPNASTDIDHFVLARLDTAKLSLAPPADRHTLVRRVYLDLIGLPPMLLPRLPHACGG